MRHRFLAFLLVLGVFGGLCAGFFSLCHHHHHRRERFEAHIADVCVDAAARHLEKKH